MTCSECGEPVPVDQTLCRRCRRRTPEEREKQRAYRQTEAYRLAQAKYTATTAGQASLKGRRDRHRDKRRALEDAGKKLTAYQWRQLQRAYEGLCAYCLAQPGTQPDHVIPLTKGGSHDKSNVVPCCPTCNQAKSDSIGWTPQPPRIRVRF